MKSAKRIAAGVYEYRGYRVERECCGWVVSKRGECSWGCHYEALDAWETLAQAKRMIDNWSF